MRQRVNRSNGPISGLDASSRLLSTKRAAKKEKSEALMRCAARCWRAVDRPLTQRDASLRRRQNRCELAARPRQNLNLSSSLLVSSRLVLSRARSRHIWSSRVRDFAGTNRLAAMPRGVSRAPRVESVVRKFSESVDVYSVLPNALIRNRDISR